MSVRVFYGALDKVSILKQQERTLVVYKLALLTDLALKAKKQQNVTLKVMSGENYSSSLVQTTISVMLAGPIFQLEYFNTVTELHDQQRWAKKHFGKMKFT